MLKWLLLIIPLGALLLIGGTSLYLQPNDFIGCQETPQESGSGCQKADAIVVVSGGDTFARTDEGIRLYQGGWANALVLSGAAQDKTGISNAGAMLLHALQQGVPDAAIFIDEFSETTEQNALNSQSIFEREGFHSVILVTSGYHQRRASLEFDKRSGMVQVLNHPLLQDKDWSFWWWLTPRGWWLAGGELAKIVVFHIQGIGR